MTEKLDITTELVTRWPHETIPAPAVTHLLSGGGQGIPLFKVHMPESIAPRMVATLLSGYIGQGPRVEEFERAFARVSPPMNRDYCFRPWSNLAFYI